MNSVTQPFFNIFWKFHFWGVGQVYLSKNNHKKMSFCTMHKRIWALNLQQNLKFNLKKLLLWPKKAILENPLKNVFWATFSHFGKKLTKKFVVPSDFYTFMKITHIKGIEFFCQRVQFFFLPMAFLLAQRGSLLIFIKIGSFFQHQQPFLFFLNSAP